MPDLAAYRAYHQRIEAIERRLAGEVKAELRAWRLEALDAATKWGPTDPGFRRWVQETLAPDGDVAEAVRGAMRGAMRQVDQATLGYLGKVLAVVGADAERVWAGTIEERAALLAGQLETDMLSRMRTAMTAESVRQANLGAGAAATPALLSAGAPGGRVSPFRAAQASMVAAALPLALWGGANGLLGLSVRFLGGGRAGWGRQAIAAIDGRTTRTCLLLHGQVVPWNRPFELRGEPRFADRMNWAPFHWGCRTVVAPYRAEFEQVGPSTDTMVATAEAELARRTSRSRGIWAQEGMGL